ncbi:hypothetical protein TNCV_2631991 [Trichonephila clavipes]|nr:hypothetical protein TNCV_2631991 [Trichonephila clavipes]
MAPHIIPTTATNKTNAQEITIPVPTPPPSNCSKNEYFNLIIQTLQQTIQALSQLVQHISYLNISDLTPPPTANNKSKTNANISKSKIKKGNTKALFNDYLDEEDD